MHLNEFMHIYNKLNNYNDIDRLSRKMNYDREFLLVLYTQKIVRKATTRFYKVKNIVKDLHKQWKNGKSLCKLSHELDFPPVLLGFLVLAEEGITRKVYRNMLADPGKAPNAKIRKDLEEVVKKDYVYSPQGYEIQYQRGRTSEQAINKWLKDHHFTFRVETELRKSHPKTPDFLLDRPLNVRGTNINWIESKATFGDAHEIHKNLRSQLKPYREMFGPGMVIYWFGFVTPSPLTDGILIESREFLTNWVE